MRPTKSKCKVYVYLVFLHKYGALWWTLKGKSHAQYKSFVQIVNKLCMVLFRYLTRSPPAEKHPKDLCWVVSCLNKVYIWGGGVLLWHIRKRGCFFVRNYEGININCHKDTRYVSRGGTSACSFCYSPHSVFCYLRYTLYTVTDNNIGTT